MMLHWCIRPIFSVVAVAAVCAAADSPRSLVSKGNDAYHAERFDEALNAYESAGEQKPDSARIWFNKGDALYRQGRFTEAMDAFERAAVQSGDREFEALSKFNQGNSAFRQGAENARTNPGQAVESLEKSVQLYQDSLQADTGLKDARHNIEVARQFIQQLREQMKNQPQQNQQNKDEKKDQDQKQDHNQQQQQSGDENQQQEQQQQEQQQQEQQQQEQQQQEQDRQQQQKQQAQQQKPEPQPAKAANDILKKERDDKRMRQLQAVVGVQPVEKDW